MKTCSVLFRWIQVSLVLFTTAMWVRADTGKSVADGGLQMSVNTAAYRVYAGEPVSAQARARAKRAGTPAVPFRDVLVASVHLVNRSPHDLTFTFPDDSAAKRRFDFRVLDSEGQEVWAGEGSEGGVSPAQATTSTLRKRSKWSSVVRIPLNVDGEWLPPGVYTIEAALAGEPRIGATTLFEVAQPNGQPLPPAPPRLSGINGQIFIPSAANEWIVAAGASVVVEELLPDHLENFPLRTLFRWTGTTNAEGRFQVNTPPGQFRVAAQWQEKADAELPPPSGLPYQIRLPLRGSKDVKVTAGQFTDVRLDLKAGLVEIGTRHVASVTAVKIRYLPTLLPPTMLEISAEGMVSTGGWSNPQLRQRRVTPEGIIEFDFVAKPPEGMATQAFEPISAVTNVPQPPNFRGVRVFSQSNSKGAVAE